jgi:hypothetical protein
MKRKISTALFIIGILLVTGCYPGGPDYAEEMDIVMTKHNDSYNFASKATYAIPDRIVKITGSVNEGNDPEFIPDVAAEKILAMINDNMAKLGWKKVDDLSENPDLVMTVASWETTTTYYWYDYWYWWWGGYYPYWGYYPPVYYSSYTTGTLLMNLIDPNELSSNGNPVDQWSGAVNGLLTGSYNASRINEAIDKAFSISPYLKIN